MFYIVSVFCRLINRHTAAADDDNDYDRIEIEKNDIEASLMCVRACVKSTTLSYTSLDTAMRYDMQRKRAMVSRHRI